MKARAWIGVDIHKKQFTVCFKYRNNSEKTEQFERTEEGIKDFLKEVPTGSVVGVESTTWTRSFAMEVGKHVKEVIVFNTVDLQQNMDKVKKTDKTDAYRIALVLKRFEREEMSTCKIKTDKFAEVKGLLNIREQWVRRKAKTKNELRSIVEFWGETVPKKMFSNLEKDSESIRNFEKVPESIQRALLDLRVMIEQAECTVKELNNDIDERLMDNEGYVAIRKEITGIGNISAAYIISKVEEIGRFDDPKKFVSFFGLAPKVKESDTKRINMRITKRTDKAILRVLIQAAWASVRFDPDLHQFYDGLKKRKGSQKAIVAVARKLITYCYYEWKKAVC